MYLWAKNTRGVRVRACNIAHKATQNKLFVWTNNTWVGRLVENKKIF